MDTPTVSPTCSRKSFFAKLGGLFVAAGLVPVLSEKTGRASAADSAAAPVTLRPEIRAVPRSTESL